MSSSSEDEGLNRLKRSLKQDARVHDAVIKEVIGPSMRSVSDLATYFQREDHALRTQKEIVELCGLETSVLPTEDGFGTCTSRDGQRG